MTKAHMKRLLSPKVLHPRPARPVYQPGQPSSPAAASRAFHGSAAPATAASARAPMSSPSSPSPRSEAPPLAAEAAVLALGDHLPEHERNLEHSFFAAGLSEDSLRAISERQREQIDRQLPAGPAQKVVFGFAICAGLLLVTGLVGTRVIGGAGGPDLPAPAGPPASPAISQPPALPPPAAPEPAAVAAVVAAPAPVALVFGAELPPASDQPVTESDGEVPAARPAAAPVRTVGVSELRAKAIPEPEAIAAEASAVEADEPASPAAEAEPATEGERAAAATPSTEDPREACGQQLRRGEFRQIKESCSVAFEAQPDAQLAAEVARAALDDKRNREAAAWARKAIAVDARFADAFVYLGAAEHQLGHSQAAREAYGRYLQLEPQGDQAESVRAIIENL
jgi:tetratricopeptide (TPR) repeat protein